MVVGRKRCVYMVEIMGRRVASGVREARTHRSVVSWRLGGGYGAAGMV